MKIKVKDLKNLVENFLLAGLLSGCFKKETYLDIKKNILDKGIIKETDKLLVIDGVNQNFQFVSKGEVLLKGEVSTGYNGFGFEFGSGKTPTGLFEVHHIVGKGLQEGTVLINLKPTKTILGPNESGNRKGHAAEVLTRAIVLNGLDDLNKNTLSRSIYIHGTNRENNLGVKASGGCIRVTSKNAIKLADELLRPGDKVYITNLEKK